MHVCHRFHSYLFVAGASGWALDVCSAQTLTKWTGNTTARHGAQGSLLPNSSILVL